MAGEQGRLRPAAAAIGAPNARIQISAVVVWEVAIKRRLGKLDAPDQLLGRLERTASACCRLRLATPTASAPSQCTTAIPSIVCS